MGLHVVNKKIESATLQPIDPRPGDVLTPRQQSLNIGLYVATNGLAYLAAPVLYVGITQVTLCNRLGASDTVANLPSSAFFWAAILPLFITWRFPTVRSIKPVIVACYAITALGGAVVAATLYWPAPTNLRLTAIVLYGATIGGALTTLNTFLWEVVARGVEPAKRGLAFGLTFGFGPILAVLGSLFAQLVLSGAVEVPTPSFSKGVTSASIAIAPLEFPLNFATLFAASVPIMLLAAALASRYCVPGVELTAKRPTLATGLTRSARDIFSDHVLLFAVVAFVLVSSGCQIVGNITLYTPVALHRPAQDFAGYQNALRFGFKMVAGFLLGWLIVRTHAKAGMLVTAGFCLAGIVWVLGMPRQWFLVSFGLMGAGELYGIYFPNYIMNRSHPNRVRHNMAFIGLLGLVTSVAPASFGMIADRFGLPASFVIAASVIAAALVLIALGLPNRPQPIVPDELANKSDVASVAST